MTARARWLTWLIGTPCLILLQFFVLRPALYNAVFRVRNDAWVTRDVAPPVGTGERRTVWLPEPA
jgi:bacteriorhodopsin